MNKDFSFCNAEQNLLFFHVYHCQYTGQTDQNISNLDESEPTQNRIDQIIIEKSDQSQIKCSYDDEDTCCFLKSFHVITPSLPRRSPNRIGTKAGLYISKTDLSEHVNTFKF